MKKRTLKGTREANTMMALVIVTTARLTGPQAQAQTFDVGSVQTINGPVTYNYVSIGIVSAPGTLNVTSDGVLNTSGLFVGDYNVGLLNVDGGTVNANFTLVGYDMQGTINVTNSGTLNTNDLVVGYVSGGLLNVNRGTVTVSGDLTRGSAGTINLNTGGTLQIGNGGTTGTLLGGTGDLENNGTLIFNRSDASSYSGILSGSGAVAKQGTGTLTFSGANTYLGTTTVNAGTLQLSNSLALQNSALDTSGAGVVTLSAVSAPTLGGLIGSTNLADVITGYGNVTALTLNPQSGASNSYLGVIANGADGMTFTKSGAGTQVLSGANTYTGVTTVSAGVLNIQNANALGTIDAGTSVTSGAALQIEGGITTAAEALTLNGTGVSADGALRNISGENTYAGLVTLGEATRINSDAGTLTLSNMGRIQASGSGIGLTVGGAGNTTIAGIETSIGTLTKDGAGTLTLTQSSGFSGGLAVNEGTVRLLTSGYYALNTSGSVSIVSGAVLSADQTENNHHHIGEVTLNGGTLTSINGPAGPANDGGYGIFFLQGGVTVGGSSMSTISATTVGFNNGSFNVGDVAVGTDLLVSSHLVPSGGGSLIKTGDGTMTLTGANTYETATTISAGTLQIGAGGTTGSLSANSAITNNGTLSFNRSNTITQGTDFHSEISGTGAVTQAGSGTLVLSGTNTYSGATTISAGTLELSGASGALTDTSGVNINGGTLLLTDVTDRINNAAVISLGADTGDSILRLSGNVTETLGAMTLAGGNADRRVIDFGSGVGNLSMENLTGSSSQGLEIWYWTDGTDHLYVNSGSLWGGLTTSNISFFSDGGSSLIGTAQFSSDELGRNELVPGGLVPVPEASTLLGVLGLMAPLAWRERRHWMRCREARA